MSEFDTREERGDDARNNKGIRPQLAKLEFEEGQSAAARATARKRFWTDVQLLVVDFPNLKGREMMSLIRGRMIDDADLHDATQRWHLEKASLPGFAKLCDDKCEIEDLNKNKLSPAQVVPKILIEFSRFLHVEYKWVASAEQLVVDLWSDWNGAKRGSETVSTQAWFWLVGK